MPQEKKGKPDGWSDVLWDAYLHHGESDKKYVQICNRFLLEMCEQQLGPMVDLQLKLMYVMVRNGDIAMPDHFDITTGLPSLLDIGDAKDEIDVYRNWYKEHISWPPECLCGREPVEIGPYEHTVISPWFLTACRELAIRSVEGNLNTDIDVYVSGPPLEDDELLEGQDREFMLKANQDMLEYLKSGAWRITEAPIEEFSMETTRWPEESRKAYINRIKELSDAYLVLEMQWSEKVARNSRVSLGGRPLDPDHLHEKMLVMRMFGASNPDIQEACKDALLDSKGRELSDLRKTVYDRTGLIAELLGFLPASGDEEA